MDSKKAAGNNGLAVIWSSADREAALNTVLMYSRNSKLNGWWDNVRLVVWGPSAKLLSEDIKLQAAVKNAAGAGVELLACRACADEYGVSGALEELGIDVKYMGIPLTDMIKEGWTVLTF